MFLGSTSSPVKTLKNLTESEGWILERCFPQLKYWCLTPSGLWGSGGEGKAPAFLERVFLSFLDNKAQDPIWLPYLGVILTVVWRWQWSKETEWALGAGSETRLEMWPCFQCAAAGHKWHPPPPPCFLSDSELRKPGEASLCQLSCALKSSMGYELRMNCQLDWVLWNSKFQERQTTPEDRLRKY